MLVLVRTTVARRADADALADRLVERGLAACVHVQALRSTYRWQGAVERADEWLVEARTTPDRVDDVRAALLDGHPYEVPLVEALRVDGVPEPYLRWAREVTGPRP